jgi:hypothetical protein
MEQAAILVSSQSQGCSPVRAAFGNYANAAILAAKSYQILAQNSQP